MLFDSLTLRSLQRGSHTVMAPLTRSRATPEHMPDALMATYYGQRHRHWQRLPLLWLLWPLWPLWPLLWLQARHVRRITPHMPEPPGHRTGTAGRGSLVRLLVAGDSGAAGVGAPTQDQALCGQLVRLLSRHHTVQWCVLAVNGLDSPGLTA